MAKCSRERLVPAATAASVHIHLFFQTDLKIICSLTVRLHNLIFHGAHEPVVKSRLSGVTYTRACSTMTGM